jgi:Fe-Mn family superoxide dismutase
VFSRRQALSAIALSGFGSAVARMQAQAPAAKGAFSLPPLPYAADSLEPYIDAQTMEIHHGRHHAAYVNNLNAALSAHPDWAKRSIEDIMKNLNSVPEAVRTAVRNNGGGHINHALFWELLKKNNGAGPKGSLAKAIDASFGSFSSFQDQFTKAALGVFGSGWAWVNIGSGGKLSISATPNQDNPWMAGQTPILGIDVWEHAYYLKYQNRRADYVAAFYQVINWDFVADRYNRLSKGLG